MANSKLLRQSTQKLVLGLLERPELPQELALLDGSEWKALIRTVGLEDSGELLALASPEQLLALVDEDLWRPSAEGEELDLERWFTLLEVLAEAGSKAVAEKLAALSEEFLHMVLSRVLWVLPMTLVDQLTQGNGGDFLEKKFESHSSFELGDYVLFARVEEGWDTLSDVLTSWNESEPELLDRLLSHLSSAAVNQFGEADDLAEILDELEELQENAEAEREERRATRGYVSTSDARAFLRLPPLSAPGNVDAITRAYFRRLEKAELRNRTQVGPRFARTPELRQLIERALPQSHRLRAPDRRLKRALDLLAARDPERHALALDELAFLVNVVTTDLLAREKDKTAADAFTLVAERIEGSLGESDPKPEPEEDPLVPALLAWGPIGLFRKAR